VIDQSSPAAVAKPRPLSPEEEVARKTRVNNELVTLFKRPQSTNTPAYVQGIGLYTHVAAPTGAGQNPVFLPIRSPSGKRATKERTVLEAPISEEVRLAWKEVQEAIEEEEKHTGQDNMTAEQLKLRYGGLDVPDQQTSTAQQVGLQPQLQKFKELARRLEMNRLQNSSVERTGVIAQQAELDADAGTTGSDSVMQGRTSAPPSRSNTTASISEYHENDDPRRQRR
jgi:hypothetical protein